MRCENCGKHFYDEDGWDHCPECGEEFDTMRMDRVISNCEMDEELFEMEDCKLKWRDADECKPILSGKLIDEMKESAIKDAIFKFKHYSDEIFNIKKEAYNKGMAEALKNMQNEKNSGPAKACRNN